MTPRRLRWRGAGQQPALLLELQRQLAVWLQGWSVNPALLSIELVEASSVVSVSTRWMQARGRNGSAWLGAPHVVLESFGGVLASAAFQDTLGLGSRLGERALRALLTQWVDGPASEVEIHGDAVPGAGELEPRFGAFQFLLKGNGFAASVIVDSELCDHWVPAKKSMMQPLLARESALGSEMVLLEVILDLGKASLADTHGLQVGDVLVSSTSIDSHFRLTHPDSRPLAIGHLFQLGKRRALQLDSAEPMRTTS